jgi:hypothetical protein
MRIGILTILLALWLSPAHAQVCAATNVTPSAPTPPAQITPIPTPPAPASNPKADPCFIDNCPAIGTMCTDTSIYAGISPDGSFRMFTTPCNIGQTWDGSTCTGSSSTLKWSSAQPNSPTTGSNTGKSNTVNIIALLGSGGIAAKACADLTGYANTDWYLPANGELSILYTNRVVLNIPTTMYWGSTDFSANRSVAYYKDFNDGSLVTSSKINTNRVRCVRRESFK